MTKKINLLRLIGKTLLILIIISLVLVPVLEPCVGRFSLYNWLLPGRDRLPHSDTPQKAYNLSLFSLEAMFASHKVADRDRSKDGYRIFILGDSSTWGTLLEPRETIAGQLNALELTSSDGKPLTFYNLGYPTMSLTKDLLLLHEALDYDPDLIIWLFTLESFPADKQLISPLVENNPRAVSSLLETYDLDPNSYGAPDLSFRYWDSTLFGQRRNLADIMRLQFYGVMWAVTGIDQYYPVEYAEALRDLPEDTSFHGWQQGEMADSQLALEVLSAGKQAAGQVPILFVNEPILISEGINSALRYNFYYPRWAYDQYRATLEHYTSAQEMMFLDFWDLVPAEEFTNTAIHTTPYGVGLLANEISAYIQSQLIP